MSVHVSWHKAAGTSGRVVWRAWAPDLQPEATMPPYYEITASGGHSAHRVVALVSCKSCGGQRALVGTARDLTQAKAVALFHYTMNLEALTKPPKSA